MSYESQYPFFDRLAREFLAKRESTSDTDEELVTIDTNGRVRLTITGKQGFLDSIEISSKPYLWTSGRTCVMIVKPE
jgi:hypothetical protein